MWKYSVGIQANEDLFVGNSTKKIVYANLGGKQEPDDAFKQALLN